MKKEILDRLPDRKHETSEEAEEEEDLANEAVFTNGGINGSVTAHGAAASADHEMRDTEGEQK